MKKLISIFTAITLSLTLVSCGANIDSSTWVSDFNGAKKVAQDDNKKILLFFSEDEGDGISAQLKESVFNTEDFLKAYTEKYVLVNIDLSKSRYENAQDNLKNDLILFERYNASGIPSFLILSKEGYVITKLAFDSTTDLDSARITISEAEEQIRSFDEQLAKTENGSVEERLAAINKIIDEASPEYGHLLSPLCKLYLSLDKKNTSGECAKHLFAISYANATESFIKDEPEKAVEEYEALSKNKFLDDSEKQMALYTAGYLLAQSGSTDYERIKDYFQKAYDAAPDSEDAQNIKMAINMVQMRIDGEGDAAPQEEK